MSMFWPATPRDRLRCALHQQGSARSIRTTRSTVKLTSRDHRFRKPLRLSRILSPSSTRVRMAANRYVHTRPERSFVIRRWSRTAYP